jgi:hypothetical protein
MEACELILRQLSHVSRERGHRPGVTGFELGKRLEIACCRGSRPSGSNARSGSVLPRKIKSPIGRPRKPSTVPANVALTQTRVPSCLLAASSLAATFNGVAVRCVVEETAAAEIPYNRWPGMDAKARTPRCDAFPMVPLTESLSVRPESS